MDFGTESIRYMHELLKIRKHRSTRVPRSSYKNNRYLSISPLVSQQSTGVCIPLEASDNRLLTLVGSLMSVHVFVPFARSLVRPFGWLFVILLHSSFQLLLPGTDGLLLFPFVIVLRDIGGLRRACGCAMSGHVAHLALTESEYLLSMGSRGLTPSARRRG